WLRRNPLFTAAVTLILALGIGANTAVFSIVDAVLLRGIPYAAPDRLVRGVENTTKNPSTGVPARDLLRFQERSDIFERTVPYIRDTVTIRGSGEPDQVIAIRASGLFPLLGVNARLGRALIPTDDAADAANVTVISDRLWQRRFHSDPSVIGRGI